MADKHNFIAYNRRLVFNHYLTLSGITIKTLAEKCGYQPSTMYNMLHTGEFSQKTAEKISKALNCEARELLEGQFLAKNQIDSHTEKNRMDHQIVEDELVFLRVMLLSQQRTIENLSFIVRNKLKEELPNIE